MTSEILISTKLFLSWRMRLSPSSTYNTRSSFWPGFPRRATHCPWLPTVSATALALPTFPNPLLCLWISCVDGAGCGAWVCRQTKCSLSKERLTSLHIEQSVPPPCQSPAFTHSANWPPHQNTKISVVKTPKPEGLLPRRAKTQVPAQALRTSSHFPSPRI